MNATTPRRRLTSLYAAILLAVPSMLVAGGCANDAQSGLLMGTAAGAGIGAIVGHNTGRRTAEGRP